MFDPNYHDTSRREPSFYLARALGPTMSVLVVMLVLFASIRQQLLYELRPTILHLGIAHVRAILDLTLFGEPDTITVFSAGHKTYPITRFAIANAGLFVECWQAVLGRIEVGVILAIALILGPRAAWLGLQLVMDPGPAIAPTPDPLRMQTQVQLVVEGHMPRTPEDRYSPANDATSTNDRQVQESAAAVEVAQDLPPSKEVVSIAQAEPEPTSIPAPMPPTFSPTLPPPIEPGQIRKRPRPEA